MDIAEEFDRAIGDGPPHQPLAVRLAAGRRAVRRRRVGRAAGAMAFLVVVSATLPAALGRVAGAEEAASDIQAASPVGAVPPEDRRPEPVLSRGAPVAINLAGDLVTLDGVRVLRAIDNPMGQTPPTYSMGVEFSFEGETYWRLLYADATSSGGVFVEGTPPDQTFGQWVAKAARWAAANRESVAE